MAFPSNRRVAADDASRPGPGVAGIFPRACSLTTKNQGQAHAPIDHRDLPGRRNERAGRLAPLRMPPVDFSRHPEGALNMDGLFLRFYFQESQKCRDGVAWEWLLEQANK